MKKNINQLDAEILSILLLSEKAISPSAICKQINLPAKLSSTARVSIALSRMRKKGLVEFIAPANNNSNARIRATYRINTQGELALEAFNVINELYLKAH